MQELAGSKEKKVVITGDEAAAEKKLLSKTSKTINKVERDINTEHQLNTAISSVMELVNELYSYPLLGCETGFETAARAYEAVILLLAPYRHICEEIWQKLGHNDSIAFAEWPLADPKYLANDEIELPIQINGKLRGKVCVPAEITENELKDLCAKDEKVAKLLENRSIVKFIYVPKRIVNIILV